VAQGKSADAVFHTADHTAALALLREQIAPGDTILIKASNAVQLHRLSDALTGGL
jgi:UDP-N-acetylmuramyl pentapeptide synthase